MIPVRCFTCGKVVSNCWEEFQSRVEEGEDAGAVLNDLGVTRYCCRRMILSHVPLVETLAPYQ